MAWRALVLSGTRGYAFVDKKRVAQSKVYVNSQFCQIRDLARIYHAKTYVKPLFIYDKHI